jgi:hypothetical protein
LPSEPADGRFFAEGTPALRQPPLEPDHQQSPPEQLAGPADAMDIEASVSSALTAELVMALASVFGVMAL